MSVRDDLAQLAQAQAAGANVAPFGPGADPASPDFPSGTRAAELLVRRRRLTFAASFGATDDVDLPVGYFPVRSRVVSIVLLPALAVVRSDSDYQTVEVRSEPADDVLAHFDTKLGHTAFSAFTPLELPGHNADPATYIVAAGTALKLTSVHTGYGADFTGAVLVVTYDELGDETIDTA